LLGPIGDDDVCAFAEQMLGDLQSDAAKAPGDQNGLIIK
jgi:hypothetical protein